MLDTTNFLIHKLSLQIFRPMQFEEMCIRDRSNRSVSLAWVICSWVKLGIASAFHGFSWRAASFLRYFLSSKPLPLSVKIVIDFGPVIAVHGSRGIIQSRQQVRLDIPHLGRVVIQAVEHILHMGEVHFQEAAFYYLTGVVIPGNADIWPLG